MKRNKLISEQKRHNLLDRNYYWFKKDMIVITKSGHGAIDTDPIKHRKSMCSNLVRLSQSLRYSVGDG